MYVCMYACMHACMHVCVHEIYLTVLMPACMYERMYVCLHSCINASMDGRENQIIFTHTLAPVALHVLLKGMHKALVRPKLIQRHLRRALSHPSLHTHAYTHTSIHTFTFFSHPTHIDSDDLGLRCRQQTGQPAHDCRCLRCRHACMHPTRVSVTPTTLSTTQHNRVTVESRKNATRRKERFFTSCLPKCPHTASAAPPVPPRHPSAVCSRPACSSL